MERFKFYESLYKERAEFKTMLENLESEGNGYLDALEAMKLEVKAQIDAEYIPNTYGTEKYHSLSRFYKDLSDYILERAWFEKYNYRPRQKYEQYDFEQFKEFAKAKPLSQRKAYWEQIAEEFETFVNKNPFNRYPIQEKFESELSTINAELAFDPKPTNKKLVWHGKPSEFGYLLSELQSKGWIGLQHGGEIVYSEFARICLELFEFSDGTTKGNLEKQLNPNGNILPDDIRERFRIPFMGEMNAKRGRKKK